MVLKLSLKSPAPSQDLFTVRELEIIAENLEAKLPDGCVLVHIGQQPPADLKLRWQPTDQYGGMVGQIKSWNGSTWV